MRPAQFELLTPTTLDEAVAALGREVDGRPLAGGQSLIALMNLRLATPETLIDLGRVPELAAIGRGLRVADSSRIHRGFEVRRRIGLGDGQGNRITVGDLGRSVWPNVRECRPWDSSHEPRMVTCNRLPR